MNAERNTPGKVQRREWEQPWAERVPKELLIVGKVYLEAIRLVLEDKGPSHNYTADWEKLYQHPPAENISDLCRMLAPDSGALPSPLIDDQDASLDDWVKKVARYVIRASTNAQSCSPHTQAQLVKHARDHLSDLRVEIRVYLDIVAAIVLFQTHPAVLAEKARSGDPDALEKLLQINPSFQDQPWVRNMAGELVRNRGLSGIESFQKAITNGLQIRKSKLIEIGSILVLLWPMVRRLTTDQRRGYLKALGLTAVPAKKALREFERRLNLKSILHIPKTNDLQV